MSSLAQNLLKAATESDGFKAWALAPIAAERIQELEARNKELLEALCYLLETSTGQTHEQWLEAMDRARAAIAKAKGEGNE